MIQNSQERRLTVLGWSIHAAGAASLVLAAAGYHWAATRLTAHHLEQIQQKTAEAEALLATASATRQESEQLQRQLADLEQRAETTRQRIPEQPQEAEFLQQFTQAAEQAQVRIVNYTRRGVTQLPTHSALSIQVNCEGKYAGYCQLFDELNRMPREATAETMTLDIPDDSEIYPLQMTLTLYYGAKVSAGG